MPKKTTQKDASPTSRLEVRYPGIGKFLRNNPNCEAARHFGFSQERARQIRAIFEIPAVHKHDWERARRASQIRKLASKGKDASTIESETGIGRSTIWTIATEDSIEIPVARSNMPTNTPDEIEGKYPGITEMLRTGRGALRKVSREYELSYTHVSRLRNRLAEAGVVEKDWDAADKARALRKAEWASGRRGTG